MAHFRISYHFQLLRRRRKPGKVPTTKTRKSSQKSMKTTTLISGSQKRNRSPKNPSRSRRRHPNGPFPIRTRTPVLRGNLPKPSNANLKTAPTAMPTRATIMTRCSMKKTVPSLAKRNRLPPKNQPQKGNARPLRQVIKKHKNMTAV